MPKQPSATTCGVGDPESDIEKFESPGSNRINMHPGGEVAGRTVILEGLTAGQKVVASGQFLIDSEASLKGVLTRLGAGSGGSAPNASAARQNARAVRMGRLYQSYRMQTARCGHGSETLPTDTGPVTGGSGFAGLGHTQE